MRILVACQIVADLLAPDHGPKSKPPVRPALQLRVLDVTSRLAGVAGADADATVLRLCARIVQRVAEGQAARLAKGRASGASAPAPLVASHSSHMLSTQGAGSAAEP